MARFDDKGILTSGVDQIRQEVFDNAKIKLAPYLDGKELLTDDSSIIGRLVTLLSMPIAQNEEILPLILSSLDPNQAEGQALDNFGKIHWMRRLPAAQASGLILAKGRVGTFIGEGSRVSNVRNGDSFYTTSDLLLDENSVNSIDVEITSIEQSYRVSYTIDGLLSTSPVIEFTKSSNDTTVTHISNRLVDAVNAQSTYLTAKRNNDNTVTIEIKDRSRVGDFGLSTGLIAKNVTKPVEITSLTYGSDEADINTITSINTATQGWLAVTNPFKIEASRTVESDEDFRYRINLIKGNNHNSSYNSLLYRLNSTLGVSFCNVVRSYQTGGVDIIVQGGDPKDVAVSIFNSIPIGTITNGDIDVMVKDINGGEHPIKFSRPITVPLQISLSMTVYQNFPTAGEQQIKQAIVEWFNSLNVGEDIYYSRLYEPINEVKGFSVRNLKIGRLGGSLGMDDIILRNNEIATISAENISIGGR